MAENSRTASLFTIANLRFKSILQIDHLALPADHVTCILGPSGSGKSTFLRMLDRILTPDEGDITYHGKDIREYDPVLLRREVVMLPQNPALFDGNVRENLIRGCVFADKPIPADDELRTLLQQVLLDKKLDGPTTSLSGGERQRLAIARVLAMKPNVMLLDEPSSALDQGTEESVIAKIVEGAKRAEATLIMVTHSRRMADQFGENLLEIRGGKLVTPEVNA